MNIKLLDRAINWSLVLLFFLVPLFFTSVNFELFEFNKIVLIYLFAALTFCMWVLKKYLTRDYSITKSPLDLLLLVFLVSQLVSFIFSIDRHTSFWGYYSRFNGGLLSLCAYIVIFKVIVDQKSSTLVKRLIKTSLVSGLIIALYAVFEHFGHSFSCLIFTGKFDVSCWVQDVQNRVYATLGQPNWLAAYLIVLIPITWGLILGTKFKVKSAKFIVYCLLLIAYYSCLLFTKSRSGFLGFTISYLIFWSLAFLHLKKQIVKPFLIFSLSLFLLTFVIGSPFSQFDKYLSWNGLKSNLSLLTSRPFTPSIPLTEFTVTSHLALPTPQPAGPQLEVGGTESGKIRAIVWRGAIDIFKHYPLFGSGPETFAYSYYRFRPMEHNLVSEWDFLYNKAHNEYLNYLATTGIIGFGAYMLFCCGFIFFVIRRLIIPPIDKPKPNQSLYSGSLTNYPLIISLTAGFIGVLVSNFFGFSVVISNLYLFTIPGMVIVLLNNKGDTLSSGQTNLRPANQQKNNIVAPGFTVVLLLFIGWQILNLWRADFHYSRGDKLSKQQQFLPAYEELNQALILNPNEPIFQMDLAFAAANLAFGTSTGQDATTTAQLIDIAQSLSNKSYQTSPYNMNLLKTRIKILYALSLIDPKYSPLTIEAIQDAISKSPTDPKLVYNLGLMYGKNGEIDLAIKTIEESVTMKPNFADARNALAQYFETLHRYPEAIEHLHYLNRYINPNDQTIVDRIQKLESEINQ